MEGGKKPTPGLQGWGGGWLTVMTVAVTAGGKDPRQKTPAHRTEAPDPCPGRSLLPQRLCLPLGLVGSAQKVGSGGGLTGRFYSPLPPNPSTFFQMVKNLPAMQETQVGSLGPEDPLGEETASHPSTLAWRTPWAEEPGGLRSMGLQRVRHDCVTNTHNSLPSLPLMHPS